MRDQDSHPDCKRLKQQLLSLCAASGKHGQYLVRIACTELETFYLADLQAVEHALGINGLAKQQLTRKFRTPDRLGNPSQELKTLTGNAYQKIAGSRVIGKHLALDNDRSPSFHNLVKGIRQLQKSLLPIEPPR